MVKKDRKSRKTNWLTLKHSLNIYYREKIMKCIQKTNSGAEKENIAVKVISQCLISHCGIF